MGVAAALATVACMGGSHARAVKLYAGPRSSDAVILVGDVKAVDGNEVPLRSRTFELQPGCHTVTNITYWVGNDINAAMTVRLPEMVFWMKMVPEHTYELRIGTTANTDTARVTVKALERDTNGDVTHTYQPGKGCD